jgi:hypothetical protein
MHGQLEPEAPPIVVRQGFFAESLLNGRTSFEVQAALEALREESAKKQELTAPEKQAIRQGRLIQPGVDG